jgi:hypothetical protein
MDYQMMWLTAGWTVALVFIVVTLFFFAVLFRAAGDVVKMEKENKKLAGEVLSVRAALNKSEREQGVLRTYQGQLLRQIAGLEKERAESERRENAVVKSGNGFYLEAVEAKKLTDVLENELKAAHRSLEVTKQLAREMVVERDKTIQASQDENRTLRRLLAQQADATRKAMHALSPSDDLLEMLSKIADDEGDS